MGIQFYHNKKQNSEGPQGRTAVTEKRQRNSDNRKKSDGHPDIDGKMEEKHGRDTVAVDSRKGRALSFGQKHEPVKQGAKKYDHGQAPGPAPFFADGTENKIGALFRHKIKLGLCAFQKTFAGKPAGTDRDFGLIDLITAFFRS